MTEQRTEYTAPPTAAELEQWRRLCDAVKSQRWVQFTSGDGVMGVRMDKGHEVGWDMEGMCDQCIAIMAFVAESRSAMPRLIAEVRRLQGEVEILQQERDMWRTAAKALDVAGRLKDEREERHIAENKRLRAQAREPGPEVW